MENIVHKEFGMSKYQYRIFLEMILGIIRSCKDLEEAKSKIERLIEN